MTEFLHLALARAAIDRDYRSRTHPDLFDELWANPQTRVLVFHNGKTLLQTDGQGKAVAALNLLPVDRVPSAQLRAYLGKTTDSAEAEDGSAEPVGTPVVLAVLSDNSANQLEPRADQWHELRRNGAGLSDRDAGVFTQALALANWHDTHQYCPKCGTPTMITNGGWVRKCFKDETELYPRTDPAIICAVIDHQDRILLGSQASWDENRWSVLAGFVEPGESLSAAVIREIFEESGVLVEHPQYLGSQAWPFPYSLMAGFTARVVADHVELTAKPDQVEIEKLRWFSRAELAAALDTITLPSRVSIARSLIENWYGGPLVDASER